MKKINARSKMMCTALTLASLASAQTLFAHEWMAPKEAAEVQNPISFSASSASQGKKLFLNNCAACHGDDGKGLSADTVGLEKDTPNLPQRLKNHTDGDFFWKIQNGRGEMPSFEGSLKTDEIWHIINFIKGE